MLCGEGWAEQVPAVLLRKAFTPPHVKSPRFPGEVVSHPAQPALVRGEDQIAAWSMRGSRRPLLLVPQQDV